MPPLPPRIRSASTKPVQADPSASTGEGGAETRTQTAGTSPSVTGTSSSATPAAAGAARGHSGGVRPRTVSVTVLPPELAAQVMRGRSTPTKPDLVWIETSSSPEENSETMRLRAGSFRPKVGGSSSAPEVEGEQPATIWSSSPHPFIVGPGREEGEVIVDHDLLNHLGYAESGHTGFEPLHVDYDYVVTFFYDGDNDVDRVEILENGETTTTQFSYNLDKSLAQAVTTAPDQTRTATMSYNGLGDLSQIAVVLS